MVLAKPLPVLAVRDLLQTSREAAGPWHHYTVEVVPDTHWVDAGVADRDWGGAASGCGGEHVGGATCVVN